MSREEFLRELENALVNDVPEAVIRDNVNYYSTYISQEMANGRTVDEIVDEIGEPRIVARTIIDSYEGAEESVGSRRFEEFRERDSQPDSGSSYHFHYIDLNKWYWKLSFTVISVLFFVLIVNIVGGILTILLRLAGPILLILLVIWIFKDLRK